jgi:hypothetical protein
VKHRFLAARSSVVAFIALLATNSTLAANVVSGQLWHVPDAIAQNATPANLPGRTADVTFDVNSPLNFNSPNSVQSFLTSGAAFNIIENTSGTLASAISNGTTSTLINFTGTVSVSTGQKFTVTHDDGLTLVIGTLNLGFGTGPTGPTTTTVTYTGPTGSLPFQLVYGECCGGSAVLQVDLPFTNAVPEPTQSALFLLGMVTLATLRRRVSKKRVFVPSGASGAMRANHEWFHDAHPK